MTIVDGIGTWGGAESLAHDVAIRLDPDRFHVTFCVTRWEPLDEYQVALDELREAGVEFLGLERRWRFDVGQLGRLRRAIRDDGLDIVHAHQFGSNFWASILGPSTGSRALIAQEHGSPYTGEKLFRFLERWLIAPRADCFVTVSREEARRMVEVHRIPADMVRVVSNGIPNPDGADANSAALRRELKIAPDDPLVGIVATLRHEKNLELLIDAARELVGEFPGLRVVIIGGPADRRESEAEGIYARVRKLRLADTVRFLGLRSDVVRLLSALDVAVLCSKREGSPLAIMEYMAAGLPVVATSVGGIPEIVVEGQTGLLVSPDDSAAFAGAIASLLRDPERARRMGEAGRRRQQDEFTIEATVRRVEARYEELAASKGLS